MNSRDRIWIDHRRICRPYVVVERDNLSNRMRLACGLLFMIVGEQAADRLVVAV